MKLIIAFAFILSAATTGSGCNSNNQQEDVGASKEVVLENFQSDIATNTTYQSEPAPPPSPRQSSQTGLNDAPPAVKIDWDKKIVKTATLQAEVKDLALFSQGVAHKVKALGGYISQEQQNQSDYRIENAVTIKVPVGQFDQAVAMLLKDVQKVDARQISSEDVTGAYIDSKSRLEAKKEVRLRCLELLKSARNMKDIIEVQKEINDIQEEIETVTGRINYLGHASAMSTISLTYYQVLNASAGDTGTPGFIEELRDSFANGWYWLGELLIGLVAIWPLVLIVVFVALLIRKKQLLRSR
jgi:hypothetical protein